MSPSFLHGSFYFHLLWYWGQKNNLLCHCIYLLIINILGTLSMFWFYVRPLYLLTCCLLSYYLALLIKVPWTINQKLWCLNLFVIMINRKNVLWFIKWILLYPLDKIDNPNPEFRPLAKLHYTHFDGLVLLVYLYPS